jgi:hypothetical protein
VDAWQRKQGAARRRKELRERAVAYLGGKCQICAYDKCASGFDFHHIEVWLKDFTISDRMTSWARIEPELKKVELLCCRCHREVHDGLHPGHIEHEGQNIGGWGDDRQLDMFDAEPDDPCEGVTSLLDPNVTPEQSREAMESVPPSPEPTAFDMVQMLD